MRNIKYTYCVEGKRGIEKYSGSFDSEYKARIWFGKYGFNLAEMFNRKLILLRTDESRGKYEKSNI